MEDTRGAVNVILCGPAERFDEALATLQKAGISAKRDAFEPAKISAFFHDGSERPPKEFVHACEERAREASEGTGFTVDRTSVWVSSAASRKLPYHRYTGEWLEASIDGDAPLEWREEPLRSWSKVKAAGAGAVPSPGLG
ncbi:hypothetical protein ACWIG5_31235 [Streptomyces lydicus]